MKKLSFLLCFVMLLLCVPCSIFAEEEKPEPTYVLAQFEKMMDAFADRFGTEDSTEIQYPDNFGGAYYGEDGYMHINLAAPIPDGAGILMLSGRGSIYDSSVVKYHSVKYSINDLREVRNTVAEKMLEFDIIGVGLDSEHSLVKILATTKEGAASAKKYLDERSIPEDMYVINLEEGAEILPC